MADRSGGWPAIISRLQFTHLLSHKVGRQRREYLDGIPRRHQYNTRPQYRTCFSDVKRRSPAADHTPTRGAWLQMMRDQPFWGCELPRPSPECEPSHSLPHRPTTAPKTSWLICPKWKKATEEGHSRTRAAGTDTMRPRAGLYLLVIWLIGYDRVPEPSYA